MSEIDANNYLETKGLCVKDIVSLQEQKHIFTHQIWYMKGYLVHIQNSVFEGNLSKANSLALQKELDVYIRKDKDSVIMFHTREERWMNKDFLGKTDDKTSNFL